MPRPCHLAHPDPVPDSCRLCSLYVHDERYRRKWDDPAHTLPEAAARLRCRHLGAMTGETVACQACGGLRRQVPVYACAVHGTCTPTQLNKGRGCCRICPDHSGATPEGTVGEGG